MNRRLLLKGARGNHYGGYAKQYPVHLDIVGVAEPIVIRNERYMASHDIAADNSFTTWEHVFDLPGDEERDSVNKILSGNPAVADKLGKYCQFLTPGPAPAPSVRQTEAIRCNYSKSPRRNTR